MDTEKDFTAALTTEELSMLKTIIALLTGLCLLIFFLECQAEGSENSCVKCHRDLPKNTYIASKFLDWEGSIHAKEGMTCQRCHGGDPEASGKEAAHTGVYNSGNPRSRVFYKSVPGTCGACHRRDFNAFKNSKHYTFLEKSGAGPTCVTCHESHSTRIISPEQIPTVCNQCHNERMQISPNVPMHAQALLLLLNETSFLVRYAGKQTAGGDQEIIQTWRDAHSAMERTRDEWHAFNLKQVQSNIQKVYSLIVRVLYAPKKGDD